MTAKQIPNWANLSYFELRRDVQRQLSAIGITEAEQEAQMLLQAAFGQDIWQKILEPTELADSDQFSQLATLLKRRLAREPLSHILQEKGFWTLELKVNHHVLTPRADTETLVEVALKITRNCPTGHILDLGTGSGAVLLAFLSERPNWRGTGIDISPQALEIAKTNARANKLLDRTQWIISNWDDLPAAGYDLVVSNPPYISSNELAELEPEVVQFEPKIALDGGNDGLNAYRTLAAKLELWLHPDGVFAFEIGHQQAKYVTRILQKQPILHGFQTTQDLAKRDRVVSGKLH